jgi:hypothetical protein
VWACDVTGATDLSVFLLLSSFFFITDYFIYTLPSLPLPSTSISTSSLCLSPFPVFSLTATLLQPLPARYIRFLSYNS